MQKSVYNKPFNESFIRKFEAVKYNANLVITGAIRGTYRERLCHEFGLESSVTVNDLANHYFFHEIVKGFSTLHLQVFRLS